MPPGMCPWIPSLHHVLQSVEDAPGRAESLRESLQIWCHVAILGLGAQLEPLPPALCTPTETLSPRSSTYQGRTPVENKTHPVRHVKTHYKVSPVTRSYKSHSQPAATMCLCVLRMDLVPCALKSRVAILLRRTWAGVVPGCWSAVALVC